MVIARSCKDDDITMEQLRTDDLHDLLVIVASGLKALTSGQSIMRDYCNSGKAIQRSWASRMQFSSAVGLYFLPGKTKRKARGLS